MAEVSDGLFHRSWQDQVKRLIRRRYAHVARTAAPGPAGVERARAAGYPQTELDALPEGIASAFAGCGYPLEGVDLSGVRVVVDLGCGAGLDARLVAERLENGGAVVALDLTHAMLRRARKATAGRLAATVLPVAGDMELLPLRESAADLILANASFNLAPDKAKAFAEAARVLRPGGRLVARDLIRTGELPAEIACDPTAWNASLGGVMEEEELREVVRGAGFGRVRISHHRPFPPVIAVRLTAVKPTGQPRLRHRRRQRSSKTDSAGARCSLTS